METVFTIRLYSITRLIFPYCTCCVDCQKQHIWVSDLFCVWSEYHGTNSQLAQHTLTWNYWAHAGNTSPWKETLQVNSANRRLMMLVWLQVLDYIFQIIPSAALLLLLWLILFATQQIIFLCFCSAWKLSGFDAVSKVAELAEHRPGPRH